MLFALLFDGQNELIAAAPAVFQYAVGNAYWQDSYLGELQIDADAQTAYVEIQAPDLVEKLNSLELDDQYLAECRQRIQQLRGLGFRSGPQSRAA